MMPPTKVSCAQINLQHAKEAVALLSQSLAVGQTQIALIQEPYHYNNVVKGLELTHHTTFVGQCNANPRTCIVVSNEIATSPLTHLSGRDLVAVQIKLVSGTESIVFASVYLPFDATYAPPGAEVIALVEHCKRRNQLLIMGCDANAHHTIWGSSGINQRGKELFEFIGAENLFILNKGCEPTYVIPRRSEVIDLTLLLGSRGCDLIQNWRVSEETSLSDHRVIRFDVTSLNISSSWARSPRNTDWSIFNNQLSESLNLAPYGNICSTEQLDEQALALGRALFSAYEKACPLKKLKSNRSTPWWNSALGKKRKATRKLQRIARASNSVSDWRAFLELQKELKSEIRKAKRDSWRGFCGDVENLQAAAKFHKLVSKDPLTGPGTLKRTDGSFTSNEAETLELLMETHFPDGDSVTVGSLLEVSTNASETNQVIHNILGGDKVTWAIESFSPFKSAGLDGIFPALLQHSLDLIADRLKSLFESSLKLGHIPKVWTLVKVIFIPKQGKSDYTSPKSFRPISLTSFLLKTLERLVDRFVRDTYLARRPLHKSQHAYRECRSTETALHQLTYDIEDGMSRSGYSLVSFLDIEGAFDNTSFATVTKAAKDWGFDDFIIKWIESLLDSRKLETSLNGVAVVRNAKRGCPQGGVLSPLLWLLVVDFILCLLSLAGFIVQGFADDIAILIKGRFVSSLCDRMREAFRLIEAWCKGTGLKVNPAKTSLMLFTTKRLSQGFYAPILFGKGIDLVQEVKYLGVILDPKLSWRTHLGEKIRKALNCFWLIRNSVGKSWGLSPSVVSWIYTAVARPLFAYASIVWWSRTELFTAEKELDHLQRVALAAICGATSTAPLRAMEALLGFPPLAKFVVAQAMHCCSRIITQGLWMEKTGSVGHTRIRGKLESCHPVDLPCDRISPVYSFNKPFCSVIGDRADWAPRTANEWDLLKDHWFTDGSRRDERSGAGVFCKSENINWCFSLGDHASVFQTEVYAILMCVEGQLAKALPPPETIICSDSQAAIKAISAVRVDSGLVLECIRAITKLATVSRVTLKWVPGHCGVPGNERADELAAEGADKAYYGPEPLIPVPSNCPKGAIENWLSRNSKLAWSGVSGQVQAKQLIEGFSDPIAKTLLGFKKYQLRAVVGVLTGHWLNNSYKKRIGLRDDPDCDFCGGAEDTSVHFLCHCPFFQLIRLRCFGDTVVDPAVIRKARAGMIWEYLWSSRRIPFVHGIRSDRVSD